MPSPRLSLLVPAALLTLGALACSSPAPSVPLAGRPAPPAAVLTRDWLDGGASLDRAHFERLLDVAAQDPTSVALLERAAIDLRRQGPADLFGLLSVCPAGGPEDAGGHTRFEYDLGVFSLDLDSMASGKLSAQAQQQLDQSLADPTLLRWSRQDFPDYVLVRRTHLPRICLVRGMDVSSAYETLLHEVTHAARRDPQAAPGLTAQVAEPDFLVALAQLPGDEVDAYLAGTQARIRLDRGRARVHKPLVRLFDDQGAFTASRELLARVILAPAPAGLGYATSSMRDAYAQAREAERGELSTRLRVVEATLDMRRQQQRVFAQNIEAHTHNVDVFQQHAALARQSGDQAAQQKALARSQQEAALADDARKKAALADTSLRRLETERTRLQAALR